MINGEAIAAMDAKIKGKKGKNWIKIALKGA